MPVLPLPISWPAAVLLSGAVLLAWHPALWLVRTWTDPSYASDGGLAALAVAGLLAWSVSSPRRGSPHSRPIAACLVATGLIRLASEFLGMNVLGAITLAIDVGVVALWLGSHDRQRAVSPFWLGVLFAFALPLERIVQRLLGYLLQQVSATGACGLLSLGPDPVKCEGLRILLNGREALVDLPCSGTRGLVVLLTFFVIAAALARPGLRRGAIGIAVAVSAALVANVVRITILALGIAYPESAIVDVMAQPWHDAIGLATLGLASLPILIWARTPPLREAHFPIAARARPGRAVRPAEAILFFATATLVIAVVPTRPIDVAAPARPIALPAALGGRAGLPDRLTPQEIEYFTRYGGSAARTRYGSNVLTVVQTTAPLRHLHAPDECLRGAGYAVRHVDTSYASIPTATYRAEDPDGTVWRIAVSFVSGRGERAASVSEAAWRWMQAPGAVWTMVQRITPWSAPDPDFEAAALRALDLPSSAVAATVGAVPVPPRLHSQGG